MILPFSRVFDNYTLDKRPIDLDDRVLLKLLGDALARFCVATKQNDAGNWAIEPMRPFHIIAIGQKMALGEVPDNRAFLSGNAAYCRRSPFASDRVSRSAVA